MRNLRNIVGALLCALCLAAPALAADAPVTLKHPDGEVTVARTPERVVIMDYGMLDSLDALMAAGAVNPDLAMALPQGNIPSYLGKYKDKKYTDIGGLREFNLETVHGFKPDLIIISGRQRQYYKDLSSIAPVWVVNSLPTEYVGGSVKNIRDLAAIFRAEDAAEKAIGDVLAAIKTTSDKAKASNLKALVLLTNDGKISAYGSKSRYGIIHDAFGFDQADEGIKVGTHGQLINYEYIAQKNPDIIFVVDRTAAISGKTDGVRVLNNELVNATNAAKNRRIIALDPSVWYLSGGGLQSLKVMAKDVERALN